MKIYKIFLKRSDKGVIEDLELIKEGFNIFPLIFQVFYLLYKKLWKQSAILFILFVIINFFEYSNLMQNYLAISIQVGILIYVCFECNDWINKKLIKKGYEYLGYSSGNDEKEAKLKFLENINQNYSNNDKLEQKIF